MKKFEIIELINGSHDPVAQELMLKVFNMLCGTTYRIKCGRVSYRAGSLDCFWCDVYSLYKELEL